MALAPLRAMRRTIEILSALIIFGTLSGLSFAGSSAKIMVTATVVARVTQSVIHQETTINITQEDIQRGFVEVPSATILQVKTNARNGYGLFFEGNSEIFQEISVIDKGRTTIVSPNGAFVHQPHPKSNLEIKELSYKLQLKENIQPGLYSWPFRVRASLL